MVLKKLFSFVGIALVMWSCSNLSGQQALDMKHIQKWSSSVSFPPSIGATLKPGTHVRLAGASTIDPVYEYRTNVNIDEKTICESSCSVVAGKSSIEETNLLAASVVAQIGLWAKGSIEYQEITEGSKRSECIFALAQIKDGVSSMNSAPKWNTEWKLPKTGSREEKLKAFVRQYGTHYCRSVISGRSIAMLAVVKETDQKRRNELKSKLRAGFMAFESSGDFAAKMEKELDEYDFDFYLKVLGGKLEIKGRESDPAQLLCTNLADAKRLLQRLARREINLGSTVIAAEVGTLASIVPDEEISKALSGDVEIHVPEPKFGEPVVLSLRKQSNGNYSYEGKANSDGFIVCYAGANGSISEVSLTANGLGRGRLSGNPYGSFNALVRKGDSLSLTVTGNPSDINVYFISFGSN